MAVIVIKDLPDSIELDRDAMRAIAGGARNRGRPPVTRRAGSGSRMAAYPGTPSPLGRGAPYGDRQVFFRPRKPGTATSS